MTRPAHKPEEDLQCVILVGGLGTRLGGLVADTPKPMLQVGGRPFLDHLIENYRRFGFRRFCLLAGYKADVISRHYADDETVTVVQEPAQMGTAGALKYALPNFDEWFLLANGDTYFDFNVLDLVSSVQQQGAERCAGVIAVRDVADASRYGVVSLKADGQIIDLKGRPESAGAGLINGGVYWLSKAILRKLEGDKGSLEEDVFPRLVDDGVLFARHHNGLFVDIGVPPDFEKAQSLLPCRRPAVFFDRDGVLNHDAGYTHRIDDFEWIQDAPATIRRFNDLGWLVFVVTNQAGVAKGHYHESAVSVLHAWMNESLRPLGAHIDGFRYCPYHEDGVVPEYTRASSWRKPAPGMILDLMNTWHVDAPSSVLIGDKQTDIAAADAAGIRGLLFGGGSLDAFCAQSMPGVYRNSVA